MWNSCTENYVTHTHTYHPISLSPPLQAKSVIGGTAPPSSAEFLEHSTANKEHLLDEFNTLAVSYGVPVSDEYVNVLVSVRK